MATKKARPGRKPQFTHYEFTVKFKVANSKGLTKREVARVVRLVLEDNRWVEGPVRVAERTDK